MKKKLFGIPIPFVALFLCFVLTAGAVGYAAYYFQREQGATVVVSGGNLVLYTDSECTTELSPATVLDFSELDADVDPGPPQTDPPISIFCKNEGTKSLAPEISSDVDGSMKLVDATLGDIDGTPVPMWDDAEFTLGTATNTLAAALDASATVCTVSVTPNPGVSTPATYPWGARFPDTGEVVKVVSLNGFQLTIVRAQCGTTATAHSSGATINFGPLSDADYLEPGEVYGLSLYLEGIGDLSGLIGDTTDFIVEIEASEVIE